MQPVCSNIPHIPRTQTKPIECSDPNTDVNVLLYGMTGLRFHDRTSLYSV